MDNSSGRLVLLRRMVTLAMEGENEQACVAAARTAAEMIGALGAKATPMSDSEQRRASDMSPEEMRRELERVHSVSIPPRGGEKGLQ
jgi:hypothetical protein